MIFVANDAGSRELLPDLQKRAPAMLLEQPYGDFTFAGVGPGGKSIAVAIERKTWSDLISSLEEDRLETHQLPGMLANFDRRYLLLEGMVRQGMGGVLETFRPYDDRRRRNPGWYPVSRSKLGWTWDKLHNKITGIEEIGGLTTIYTNNKSETCDAIAAKFRWWQKPYEEHSIFRRLKQTLPPHVSQSVDLMQMFESQSWLRAAFAQFPMIGWAKSEQIEQEFGTMLEAVGADEKRWRQVAGIGKTLAARIVKTIRTGGTGK